VVKAIVCKRWKLLLSEDFAVVSQNLADFLVRCSICQLVKDWVTAVHQASVSSSKDLRLQSFYRSGSSFKPTIDLEFSHLPLVKLELGVYTHLVFSCTKFDWVSLVHHAKVRLVFSEYSWPRRCVHFGSLREERPACLNVNKLGCRWSRLKSSCSIWMLCCFSAFKRGYKTLWSNTHITFKSGHHHWVSSLASLQVYTYSLLLLHHSFICALRILFESQPCVVVSSSCVAQTHWLIVFCPEVLWWWRLNLCCRGCWNRFCFSIGRITLSNDSGSISLLLTAILFLILFGLHSSFFSLCCESALQLTKPAPILEINTHPLFSLDHLVLIYCLRQWTCNSTSSLSLCRWHIICLSELAHESAMVWHPHFWWQLYSCRLRALLCQPSRSTCWIQGYGVINHRRKNISPINLKPRTLFAFHLRYHCWKFLNFWLRYLHHLSVFDKDVAPRNLSLIRWASWIASPLIILSLWDILSTIALKLRLILFFLEVLSPLNLYKVVQLPFFLLLCDLFRCVPLDRLNSFFEDSSDFIVHDCWQRHKSLNLWVCKWK